MKIGKLVKQLHSKTSKRLNKSLKKAQHHLSKRGVHLSVSGYETYNDIYLLFKRVGLHATWHRSSDRILSVVVGFKDLSLTVLNLSLSLTIINY